MIGKVILCDTCKKSTEDPKVDGWIVVATNGVTKFKAVMQEYDLRILKPLDFCSWRCFRKHWKGL